MAAPSLTPELEARVRRVTRYHDAGYCPHVPTPRQRAGLLLPHREVLYGGAAGGGKSDWLLMAALQYANVPGYAALLLRRTYSQLSKPGCLIPRSHEWLAKSDAEWSEKHLRWTFPSGAILDFGHLQHEKDKYDYQSSEYQFVGFDELTQFTESLYRYLFSRVRRPKDVDEEVPRHPLEHVPTNPLAHVPLRVRAGSNPGGLGHQWVKQRFLVDRTADRVFLPAKLDDNPHLDAETYRAQLDMLDPITRRQLLEGDWSARASGGYFRREWVDVVEHPPSDAQCVRFWDLAATAPKKGSDPDYTCGAKVWRKGDHYFVGPVFHDRITPQAIDRVMLQEARLDGRECRIRIEQEPGSSGKIAASHYAKLLAGFDVKSVPATGAKSVRFAPFASQAEAGNVSFISGPWVGDCFDELEALWEGEHDDYADGIAGAFNTLADPRVRVSDLVEMMRGAA